MQVCVSMDVHESGETWKERRKDWETVRAFITRSSYARENVPLNWTVDRRAGDTTGAQDAEISFSLIPHWSNEIKFRSLFFFMHFSHLKISGIIYVNWISKKLRCDFIERQTPIILFYKYYEWVLDIYTHICVYVYNPIQGCKHIKLEVWEIGEKSGNFANFLKSNKNFLLYNLYCYVKLIS